MELIKRGNSGTDSGDTEHKQWYHFCSNLTGREQLFKTLYPRQLSTERNSFYEQLSLIDQNQQDANNNKEACDKALEIIGRLNHMWQDYYGHGRESVENLGYISGSPDDIQAVPSSFSYWGFGGNHGGVQHWLRLRAIEPRFRAPDDDVRIRLSESYTKTASAPLLKDWFKKCSCYYFKNALESVGCCCKKV